MDATLKVKSVVVIRKTTIKKNHIFLNQIDSWTTHLLFKYVSYCYFIQIKHVITSRKDDYNHPIEWLYLTQKYVSMTTSKSIISHQTFALFTIVFDYNRCVLFVCFFFLEHYYENLKFVIQHHVTFHFVMTTLCSFEKITYLIPSAI